MILYTCGQKERHASIGHACGRAAKALDEAGYEYEIRDLPGYRLQPWTWGQRRQGREEVRGMRWEARAAHVRRIYHEVVA